MADEDRQISDLYRALGREEPPAALDAAILSASRRAAAPRRRNWALPMSLAAVVVLSVAITVQVQRERPDLEQAAPSPASAVPRAVDAPAPIAASAGDRAQIPAAPADARPGTLPPAASALPESRARQSVAERKESGAAGNTPPPFAPDPAIAKREVRAPLADRLAESDATGAPAASAARAPVAAPSAGPSVLPGRARGDGSAPRTASEALRAAPAAPASEATMLARDESPEDWLERIAGLRDQGRDREADAALKEFRQKHPDFVIQKPMLERVLAR